MKRVTFLLFIVGVFLFLSINSCKHDPIVADNIDTICFTRDILPIFQNSCAMSGCHDGNGEGDFNATSYQSIMSAVTPGNANKSRVYQAITSVYINSMPPKEPLTKDQRTKIALWINQGATNKDCGATNSGPQNGGGQNDPVDSVCFAQTILPILVSNCAVTGCHDPTTRKEGYDFSTYSTLMKKNGSIVAFNPNASKVFNSIANTSGEDKMPPYPRSSLTTTQIDAFRKWISQGAINSDCPSNSCDTLNPISFSKQVFPIFQKNCMGCHTTSAPSGNIDLSNYQQIKYYAENGRNNIPLLVGVLNSKTGFKSMPPYGKLDQCTVRTIELWINQGKSNN